MNLIKLICQDKLIEANEVFNKLISSIVEKRLHEAKQYIASEIYEDVNIVKMGRINRVRRRIRRDASGRIVVQMNARRSATKGYHISGNSIQRISAVQQLRRSLQLKRSWRTSRRSKLSRSLLKRKMSMRRRQSLGLR